MKIKELEEKRAELLKALEVENNAETRSVEKIEGLLKEVDEVNEETPPFEIDEMPKVQKDKNIKKGKLADLL